MRVLSSTTEFYPIEELDSQTKKFIASLESSKRYLEDSKWHVHKSSLVDVIRKAKATGLHSVIDLSNLPAGLKTAIDNILAGRKKSRPKVSLRPSTVNHYAILHLLPSAPPEVVQAAWKALALVFHPDRGGDPEEFLKIKQAYDVITGVGK